MTTKLVVHYQFLNILIYMKQKKNCSHRALDMREYLIIIFFLFFSLKPYVVTPHLNHLIETVQMSGHNICFLCRINKNYP